MCWLCSGVAPAKQKAAKQACGSAGSVTVCPVQPGVLGRAAVPVSLLHNQHRQANVHGGAAALQASAAPFSGLPAEFQLMHCQRWGLL